MHEKISNDRFGFNSLVGARLPQGSAPDSQDQIKTLLGEDTVGRDYVLELSWNHVLSARTKKWKYIEPNDGPKMITWGPKIETGNCPSPQLYDISSSKWESDNVAEKNPQVVYDMQNILRRERQK